MIRDPDDLKAEIKDILVREQQPMNIERILTMAVALGHHGPEIIISRNRQCDDAGERWCVRLKATNVISVHHAASYALAVDLIENEVDKWLTQRATEAQNVADVLSTALRPTDTSSDTKGLGK